MHGIVASFAEFYSKDFVGRSPEGLEEKVRRGGTPGTGAYRLLERHAENRGHRRQEFTIDDLRAPHIQWAFREYATGE